MKLAPIILLIFIVACAPKHTRDKQVKRQYILEEKPGTTPMIFAPGFISKDTRSEYGSVFNAKADEFFFALDSDGKSEILYTKLQDKKWLDPVSILADDSLSFNDPFLSPDEKKLFYISDKPRDGTDTIGDYDIWYSLRELDQWSAPINAGMSINSDANEYYISFTNDDSMYFASNKDNYPERKHDFDIYKSPYVNGKYMSPIKLDTMINSRFYEADVFIAPDESYIIYCSVRRSGLGKGDLYISFKDENGDWQKAKSMGEKINTEDHELCPFVSRDGKYFFYTSKQDIYWVSTELFEEYR